ncbi:hypothetical protein L0F51_03915 [Afifella sp. H1R]|uniref:hypothetical protein n=1 Tax=Afifella sp. H1R TaxID=2908841 RepID=UPI001F2A5C92|nr:hypothetical protein [Afifella sp. H1R]MCF1502912.1 hypothetical protein [Afifella sp. H1R]
MSLVRIAARIALVEALKGRTLVGENVRDSFVGGIDIAADGTLHLESDGPYLSVYTESAKVDDAAPRMVHLNGVVDIVLEWGVTAGMTQVDEGTGASTLVEIGIPATDANLEFLMDMVGRQIVDVLSDPDNAWAEIFRGFALQVRQSELKRAGGAEADKGTRLAAHQMTLMVELVDDPQRGDGVPVPFVDFFAAADVSDDASIVARSALMQQQLTGTDAPWKAAQRRLGLTSRELLALGLGPLGGDAERATPAMTEGTAEIPGHGDVMVT